MGHYLFESRGRDHVGRFSEKSVCNIKIAEEAEPPTLSFENYLAAVLSGKWRSLSTPSDRLLHLSPQAQSHARQAEAAQALKT